MLGDQTTSKEYQYCILHVAASREQRMQHNTKPTALPLHLLPQNHISATSLNYLRPQQHQLVTSFAIESANKYNEEREGDRERDVLKRTGEVLIVLVVGLIYLNLILVFLGMLIL